MFKMAAHIILVVLLVMSNQQLFAQNTMPDTVCVGATRVYSVSGSSSLSTFTWWIEGNPQPGNTNVLNKTWSVPGFYMITVQEHSADGCDGDIRSGLVYVEANDKPFAGDNATVCFGAQARLHGSGAENYSWSPSDFLSDPNISDPVASIPVAGSFTYVLTAPGNSVCRVNSSDTVVITVLPEAIISAGDDTVTGFNQPVQLHARDVNGTGFSSYSWSPSLSLNDWQLQSPVATPGADVTYAVTAITSNGCIATDAVTVRVSRMADIYVPTAFAPNGTNRLLHAIPVGIKEFRFFAIYNRFGELVFKTNKPSEGWDGKFKGIVQNSGGFVWMVEGVGYNGRVISKKGNVVLLR